MEKEVGKVWEVVDKQECAEGIYVGELGHAVKFGGIWEWKV